MGDWTEITDAIGLTLGGDREGGRAELLRCWADTAERDHAQRCVIAHDLGDGHLRAGDVELAALHLRRGLAAADVLGDDGYAAMIRGGLTRLQARLGEVRGR